MSVRDDPGIPASLRAEAQDLLVYSRVLRHDSSQIFDHLAILCEHSNSITADSHALIQTLIEILRKELEPSD